MEQRKGCLYAPLDIALVWQGSASAQRIAPKGLALVLVVSVLLTSVLFYRPAILSESGGNVMSLQPILIIGLVLAALLYAVAALIYRRQGMRTKRWYAIIGTCIAVLLGFALVGFFGVLSPGTAATVTSIVAALNIVTALQWRPQTAQGREH